MDRTRPLILVATLLAFAVVTLGAFVRLSNAGLGCPDWPGCYGHVAVPASLAQVSGEAHTRAWLEMIHRYAAGTLGLLILLLAWSYRSNRQVRGFAFGLLALLIFQALLGMWTVTLKLMPLVVMGHLLGGIAILGIAWWWYLDGAMRRPIRSLSIIGGSALLVLVAQIALGGWTSANYAAVACPDLPTCQGAWWPTMDFAHAFSLPDPVGGSFEGGGHDGAARTAIHLTHRLGALVVLGVIGVFAWRLYRRPGSMKVPSLFLAGALLMQLSLGVSNVLFHFPIAVAVAHTAGAALLLLTLLFALRTSLSAP